MKNYIKAAKYPDLDAIYAQCSGPGGLKLTEFMANKMGMTEGSYALDVGCNRGIQGCFLAKEFGTRILGIDPWDDRMDGRPMVEHAKDNAKTWGVSHIFDAIKEGVPDTGLDASTFDFAYSTTALEMLRVMKGEEGYIAAMKEIKRVLKPGGIFGLGEPMHFDVDIPADLLPHVSQRDYPWKDCFTDLASTIESVKKAGFEIIEADYAPDAQEWWHEFAKHDPFAKEDPEGDPRTLEVDSGRWTSLGYVIARKPV